MTSGSCLAFFLLIFNGFAAGCHRRVVSNIPGFEEEIARRLANTVSDEYSKPVVISIYVLYTDEYNFPISRNLCYSRK